MLSLGTSGTAYAVTDRPAADPSGVVAGFADATGRYLPLACTLNATVAVDRFAAWLGLDRDDVAPSSGTAVVVPFLDGERTPDLPDATGSILGLTHDTTRQEILRSAYEGAVVSLLDALAGIEGAGGADRPLVLVGGGAKGRAWREVVGRLSGRPLEIPRGTEAVALAPPSRPPPASPGSRWPTSPVASADAPATGSPPSPRTSKPSSATTPLALDRPDARTSRAKSAGTSFPHTTFAGGGVGLGVLGVGVSGRGRWTG